MECYQCCEIGRVRKENQDTVAVHMLPDGLLAVVCDGMGGMQCGKEASEIAAKAFTESVLQSYRTELSDDAVGDLLRNAAADANHAVYTAAVDADLRMHMGTTLVAGLLRGNRCRLVNVGDSRAYLLHREQAPTQLTVDHTAAQYLYERGDIEAEERATHPRRNELTRAVGVMSRVLADSVECELQDGDRLLLCSDGLYGMMTEDDIAAIVADGPFAEAAQRLTDKANENGGRDNISVILIAP